MNLAQLFIDQLTATLKAALPDHTVEAREPAESELAASSTTRQVFITTEGIELPEGDQIASGGQSAVVMVPVFVSVVMPRPGSVQFAAQTLKRRLQVMQAVQRAVRDFDQAHPRAENIRIIQEAPSIVEGFYVSITGIELTFDLDVEEAL